MNAFQLPQPIVEELQRLHGKAHLLAESLYTKQETGNISGADIDAYFGAAADLRDRLAALIDPRPKQTAD